jgi:hypothetical protein
MDADRNSYQSWNVPAGREAACRFVTPVGTPRIIAGSIKEIFLILIGLVIVGSGMVPTAAAGPPDLPGAECYFGDDADGHRSMAVIQQTLSSGARVVFRAWNGLPVPITVLFTPWFENMAADTDFPLVVEVMPESTVIAYSAARLFHNRRHTWRNDWTWKFGPDEVTHSESVLYVIPFPPGRDFPITQGYNGSWSHFDEFAYSIDWAMPIGTPVLAARAGITAFVRDQFEGRSIDPSWKARTNTITIFHEDGTMAEYSHIGKGTARVKVGDRVEAGRTIALSADVGYSGSPHLHFRVFRRRPIREGGGEESLPVLFRNARGRTVDLGNDPANGEIEEPPQAGRHLP